MGKRNVFIGEDAGYTKPKARRPAGEGSRSSKGNSNPLLLRRWQDERKGLLLFVLLFVCLFCLGIEGGEGERGPTR
jgi:hypothetical protein